MDIQCGLYGTRRKKMIRGIRLQRFLIVLMVSACVLLQGCTKEDGNKGTEEKEYETPLMMARRQGEEIMEYVVKKDKEGLKSMFSEYVSETHDLDKEIDEFFEFIDGEIISYDEPDGDETYVEQSPAEGKINKQLGGIVYNVRTTNGRNYTISFSSYYVYNTNKDKIGIEILGILDEDSWGGEAPYKTVDKYSVGD